MTALVSLLFITMIPIDCKIMSFSLYLFVNCFGDNYNIISDRNFVNMLGELCIMQVVNKCVAL